MRIHSIANGVCADAKTVLRIETARLIPADSAQMRTFFAIPFSLLLFIFPRGIGFLLLACIVGIAVAITEGMTKSDHKFTDARKHKEDCMGNYDYRDCTCGVVEHGPGQATADQILGDFGIQVNSERLSDGSKVWNVLLSEVEINCLSEEHARALVLDIAVAIRNHTNQ